MGRNPQVMATGGRQARSMLDKVEQLGITAEMSEDDMDALVLRLAEAKAIEQDKPMKGFVSGQNWYVGQLIAFAGMTPLERLNFKCEEVFYDIASEEEILATLADKAA